MISTRELSWVAGLLEGEGCFTHHRNGDVVVSVDMTDRDVMERLESILGFGTLRQRPLPSGKTAFRWQSTHQANTAGLMMTLFPLMGKRRQRKIIECLQAWKKKPLRKAMWTHCKNGHALTGDNLWITHEGKYEKRRCRECTRLRQDKYRDKQRRASNPHGPWKGMNFICLDCGDRAENYHVHDSVWFSVGMPEREVLPYNTSYGDFLCLECLSTRLGRALKPSDFSDAPINTALLEADIAELEAELLRRKEER